MTEPTSPPAAAPADTFTDPVPPFAGLGPTQLIPAQQSPLSTPYQYPGQPLILDPPGLAAPRRRRRHTGLLLSLLIVVLLVLCGGVATTAYVVAGKTTGKGVDNPITVVDDFLGAIYTDESVAEAAQFVCQQSRDATTLRQKVRELQAAQTKYRSPTYTWPKPLITRQTSNEATLTVTVTMVTQDEQRTAEDLTLTATRNNGWWVCEVQSGK